MILQYMKMKKKLEDGQMYMINHLLYIIKNQHFMLIIDIILCLTIQIFIIIVVEP
jgi:hypothetical protein